MPRPVNNGVNNTIDQQPTLASRVTSGFKKGLVNVAEALIAALSDQNTTNNANPTNNGQVARNNGQVAGNNGAAAANAPVNAPASPKSAALKWLDKQCQSLHEALINENADNRQDGLKTLYMVAKEFKEQIEEHREGLSQAWPQDLQNDFEANIDRIQAHFNGPDTTKISLHEIKFLQAYLSYMQTCLKSDHKQVAEKLKTIETLLQRQQAQPLQRAHALPKEIKNTIEQCQQKIGDLQIANRELDTHVEDHPGDNLGEEQRTRRNDLIESKRLAAQELRSTRETLQALVTEQTNITANTPADQTNLLEAASNALNEAQARNPVPDNHQAAPAVAANPPQPAQVVQPRLVQAISEEITQLNQATTKASVLHLNLPDNADLQQPEVIIQAVTKELVHQFKEVMALGTNSKNAKRAWVKATFDVKNQLDLFMANPATHDIRIPEDSLDHLKSQFPEMNETFHRIDDDQPVYLHALKCVSGRPEIPVDANDKKLALVLLGSWAAQRSAVRGNDHGETQSRTVQVMRGAANLLGSSLTDKHLTPAAGRVWGLDTKQKIDLDVQTRGLDHVSAELRKLPVNASSREYIDTYLKATAINISESVITCRKNSRELIDLAKTDRTYLNDCSNSIFMEKGLSRQGVFKDSMIRAIDLMSKQPAGRLTVSEKKESRMLRVAHLHEIKASDQVIMARLGLAEHPTEVTSDELLDQLVMASTAQNDYSTSKNHEHRGSFYNRILRYQNHGNWQNIINHALGDYRGLSDQLFSTAYNIRPAVVEAINTTIDSLENNATIPAEQVQRLVKQILITTDTKSTQHNNFDLQELLKSSENLTKNNSDEHKTAFKNALRNTVTAWSSVDDALRQKANQPDNERPSLKDWTSACNTADTRSIIDSILRANPFRSLPFVNRIPVLGKISYASFNLAKYLAAAGAGIGIAMPLVVGGIALAAISAPAIYFGHKAVKATMR